MRRIRRYILYALYMCKRVFAKPAFIFFLLLMLLLGLGMRFFSKADSQMATILLVCEGEGKARDTVNQLLEGSSAFLYVEEKRAEDATERVSNGEADAAVIFPEDFEQRLIARSKGSTTELMEFYVREDTVLLKLAREAIISSVYPYMTYQAYVQYLRQDCGYESLEESSLQELYAHYTRSDNLFQVETGAGKEVLLSENNFLTQPFRGLLSLFVVFGAFAGLLLYFYDEQNGVYDYLSAGGRLLYRAVSIVVPEVICAALCLFSMFLAGIGAAFSIEISRMFVYLIASFVFSFVLSLPFHRLEQVCVLLPVTLIFSFLFSPIFLSIPGGTLVQYLLPTFYYLHSMTRSYALVLEGIYILCGGVIGVALYGLTLTFGRLRVK